MKFATKHIQYPPHLRHVATLPWKTKNSNFLHIFSIRGRNANICLWQNGGSDPYAVWHLRSDGSRDEAGSGVWDRSTGRGTFGANLERAIVINGDFKAYVCDSAATRPSSQITLGKLVIFVHGSFKLAIK